MSPRFLSRRDAMRLVLIGTGGSAVATLATDMSRVGLAQQPDGSGRSSTAIVRTILQDLPPAALGNGAVLLHEHLSLGGPKPPEELSRIVELVKNAGRKGVSCIVDVGMSDLGRDFEVLKQIALQTSVHIVVGGGYSPAHADLPQRHPDILTKSEEQIADDLIREATTGRQGVFGEIGTGTVSGNVASASGPMSNLERKVFRAIGRAHVRTGLPIITHTAYFRVPDGPKNFGLEQLDTFESVGVSPQHIVIGHMCCTNDTEVEQAKAIAKRGAFVAFDRVTAPPLPDETKVRMVLALLEAGLSRQLILSSDFIATRRNPTTPIPEGPAVERTVTVFVPQLRKVGVSDATIRELTVSNPHRVLAFVPRVS